MGLLTWLKGIEALLAVERGLCAPWLFQIYFSPGNFWYRMLVFIKEAVVNQKKLVSAIRAGLWVMLGHMSSAQYVHITPDGLGKIVYYPYYQKRAE
jgi:hypothetical protein